MDHRPYIQTLVHDENVLRLSGSALTIGAFDGVHSGHQALIRTAVRSARNLGIPSVVYTFDPPPKALLYGVQPLTSIDDKVARISALGPDHIVIARFDAAYRARTASDFVRQLSWLAPQAIWIGADFRFGSCKGGNPELLARHFDTQILPAVCCETGEVVSSTRIRALKAAGRFSEAERLEGWPSRPAVQPDNRVYHVCA
jgi:riboflavin kinase/FMN adenylyltransferase